MNEASSQASTSWSDPDESLLLRAMRSPEGDLRAFEELALRYQKRVVANCRFITRDPNNAEDLAQEVLVKAFFGLPNFERKSSFAHWLRRIKINHCLNHLKKQKDRVFVDLGDPGVHEAEELKVAVTAEQLAGTIGEKQIIAAVLESMPSALRIPLVLCDMDELSYDEVAQTLSIGLSAAKMRIKRARDDFRIRYEKARSITVVAGRQ
jgi:RNA polymerase sigma-70 factor, ECF subfamily